MTKSKLYTLKRKNRKSYKRNQSKSNKKTNKKSKRQIRMIKIGGADEVLEDTSPTPSQEIYDDMVNYFKPNKKNK
jgi:hypothetical protein